MPVRDDLQWVKITDFSPGIVDQFNATYPNKQLGKLGSAREAIGCMAGPAGALTPGFYISDETSHDPIFNFWTSQRRPAGGKQVLCGSVILSPSVYGISTGTTWDYDNPDHVILAYMHIYDSTAAAAYKCYWSLEGHNTTNPGAFPPVTPQGAGVTATTLTAQNQYKVGGTLSLGRGARFTEDAGAHTVTYDLANVEWVVNWHPVSPGGTGFTLTHFPDRTGSGPSTSEIGDYLVSSSQGIGHGAVFHQGRYVWAQNNHTTFGSVAGSDTHRIPRSTAIFYTPVYQGTMTNERTAVTVQAYGQLDIIEDNDAIVWMHSFNANTLFVMTLSSGAYLVRGDLDRPQVTKLANLPSPGTAISTPKTMPNGVAYATRTGVYIGNEGGDSELMSGNLPRSFWVPTDSRDYFYPGATIGGLGYSDPYLFVPNNYFQDQRTGGWWQLPVNSETTPAPYGRYETSATGKVYAIPWYKDGTTDLTWCRYDPENAHSGNGKTWTWTSNIIPELLDATRSRRIRSVEIVGSGAGTVAVTVTPIGGTASTKTFTFSSNVPVRRRVDISVTDQATASIAGVEITMLATGNSSDPLPTVYEVAVGSISRESASAA